LTGLEMWFCSYVEYVLIQLWLHLQTSQRGGQPCSDTSPSRSEHAFCV